MRATFITFMIVVLSSSLAGAASFTFDFGTTNRTFLAGPGETPPDASDFIPVPGFSQNLLLVGNLTNGCGLYPGSGTLTRSGTGCAGPIPDLSEVINYDTGLDTFTLTQDTESSLQLIVKLGHPESTDTQRLNQNQVEQFDIFLVNTGGTEIGLAQLIDDVDENDGEEPNGYYRYVYSPAVIPAGTWYPRFQSVDGSIEFMTQLSAVPEPASLWLLGSSLFVLSFSSWRRKRSN
jgi:hypothetical protein